ncbi:hypothetical protein TEA_024189 [Camellia sinensis var. sinensis]|uniref:F-box domain-containing protein n=1 Tax=Camellia sinensis var. sinensis TaxID=542762 RepID=A0A4V3WLJ4_CAMSN|nr:hypothetical protein TEA_024189 [Camellia sinensis var. sinensis]
MTAALERYEKLGIGESLPRIYQYPIACREISIILIGAYSKLPKNLQSLVFQHTLTAFRLLPLGLYWEYPLDLFGSLNQNGLNLFLTCHARFKSFDHRNQSLVDRRLQECNPKRLAWWQGHGSWGCAPSKVQGSKSLRMQTQNAVSAANLLIQSAEAVLPKQKKVLAVTEFKHAKVAHKRRCKDRQEEGSIQLPQDVVVHIFSFLDLQSLLLAASVCRLWNSAASDNHLWHLQHVMYFGDSNNCSKGRGLQMQRYGILENDEHMQLQMEVNAGTDTDWRDTFKEACKGNSLKKLTSHRGYCGHCDAVVWLSNMKCSNKHCRLNSKNQQIKHISLEQIVMYIVHGTPFMIPSSDSDSGDSDSDEGSFRKLWAIPKHFSGCRSGKKGNGVRKLHMQQ